MAPLQHSSLTKVLLLFLILLLFIISSSISAKPTSTLLEQDEDLPIITKKTTPTPKISTKNQTKLIKPSSNSSKNHTKVIKTTIDAFKNQTKLTKLPSDSSKNKTKLIKTTSLNSTSPAMKKSQFKKFNSTSKPSNSTKIDSFLPKKSSDLAKSKTSEPITDKESSDLAKTKTSKRITDKESKAQIGKGDKKTLKNKSRIDEEEEDDDDDLVAAFRGLTSKFQQSIVPDLERISKTSRNYLTKYNKEFTKGFKPYVGNKYASTIATLALLAFIIIPLILVSLIFTKIKAYFSLQKLLIFVQIYLSIYFTILCLSSLATGLEPLKFFYSTSQSTYICVQVLQALAYVLYLLLLLMYLILVFSTETGLETKLLGLGQTLVGFAVGLHYYMTVFHRAVLLQPPKTSWKAHALYATCFLAICLLGRVDRRKKAYLEEGGEEGKKS